MIAMDDPRHFRLRNIVAKGFTPKQITQVEGYVRIKATAIIDRLLEQFPDGECDFVEEVAAPLPLQIFCEMMGIPRESWHRIMELTNVILGGGEDWWHPAGTPGTFPDNPAEDPTEAVVTEDQVEDRVVGVGDRRASENGVVGGGGGGRLVGCRPGMSEPTAT